MSGVKVAFSGGPELVKALADLPKRTASGLQAKALLSAGEIIRKRVAQTAPYDPTTYTHLRDHILIQRMKPRATGDDPAATAAVGIGVPKRFFYDWFAEFGTKHESARPFWRPAFDELGGTVLRGVLTEMWALLTARGASARTSGGGGGLL